MRWLWIIPTCFYLGLWLGRLTFMWSTKSRIVTLRASRPIPVRWYRYEDGRWEARGHRLFQVRRRPAVQHHIHPRWGELFSQPERYEVCLARGTRFLPLPPALFFMDQDSVRRVWEDIGERAIARLDKPPRDDISYWMF